MNNNRVTLTQLADHLENGVLIHEKFDFASWNSGFFSYNTKIPNCKTNGCAMGEMPLLDKRWSFSDNGSLLIDELPVEEQAIAYYFGLTYAEAIHLFIPCQQKPAEYGGKTLDWIATKAEVIHNIREFVKITGKN